MKTTTNSGSKRTNDRSLLRTGAIVICSLTAISTLPIGPHGDSVLLGTAYAQHREYGSPNNGSGGTSGGIAGPRGQGSGGATAAPNAGASGGAGSGPGPANQNRYGGSTGTTTPPPSVPPPPTTTDSTSGAIDTSGTVPTADPSTDAAPTSTWGSGGSGGEKYLFGRNDHCQDYVRGHVTAKTRLSGHNFDRLSAAYRHLTPNAERHDASSALHILAGYQEELGKEHPNTTLLASYLGVISTVPLNADVVAGVNSLLCVTAPKTMVERVAAEAEEQRRTAAHSAH